MKKILNSIKKLISEYGEMGKIIPPQQWNRGQF